MSREQVSEPRRSIDIAPSAIAKVILAIALVWLWLHLWQLLMLVVVAIVVAIGLEPIVERLERFIPRGVAATLVVLLLAAVTVGFFWITGAQLMSQAKELGGRLQELRQWVQNHTPDFLRAAFPQTNTPGVDPSTVAGYAFNAGRVIVQSVIVGVLALILTIYLLIEGRQTAAWLLAYAPPQHRERVRVTAMEAKEKIYRYIVGNVATSVFAALVVLVALSLLRVPAALLLAVLAGVFDFVPVLGFICSAAPAILLAMSRGTPVAIAVAAIYAGYHLAENYFIGPRVYGGQLRLSNLAVIIAFAVGAEIGGVVGALLALPVAALYPVIERVWLGEYLGREAIETHRRLERTHSA
jgi:predicted PurR-regulated permease PerM